MSDVRTRRLNAIAGFTVAMDGIDKLLLSDLPAHQFEWNVLYDSLRHARAVLRSAEEKNEFER